MIILLIIETKNDVIIVICELSVCIVYMNIRYFCFKAYSYYKVYVLLSKILKYIFMCSSF